MTILIITHKYQTASFFSLLVLTPPACYNRIMILSVSRRTDIPAFYGEWFLNRLKEGFVCVRNPMNSRQISRVELTPGRIEAIVFWTKNPAESFLEKLNIIEEKGYRFYFQFTLTPYGAEIEPGLPPPLNGSNGSPCSRRKSCRLRSRPPAYPVKRPPAPVTRWHGTITETGLWATAPPTALADTGRPPFFARSRTANSP